MSTQSKATATAVLADGDAASTEHRTIHGVAISDNEITNGLHGKKKWTPEELKKAAPTLKGSTVTAAKDVGDLEVEGALIDTNHGQRVRVGKVTDSAYEDGVGVVYEMDVRNEDIYSALALGDLDISIEASDPADVDEDEETGALIMRDYVFDGMDVVERGAARSNHTAAGPASNNQAIAALSAQDVDQILDEHNEADLVAALAASIHTPSYSGTSTSSPSWADGSWERPSKSQFDSDDLSEIADHFIASASGFDSPDNFSDLKLPVVEPNGNLNLNGLRAANNRVSQTSGLGDDKKSAAKTKIQSLAEDEFDEDLGGGQEAANADAEAAAEESDPAESESEEEEAEAESEPEDGAEEESAGDTDDPNEGEVSADDGSDDEGEDSQSAADAENNDSGTDVKSESDMQESPESDDPDEDVENAGDDDPENPESTPGPDADETFSTGNSDEDAETSAESSSDDSEGSADEANETDSTMSNDNTPEDEESTDTENENEGETQQQEQAGLNLDGQVVIDEDRHDELKTKAAMAEEKDEENADLKRKLKKREEQIGVVNEVYNAALADAGPHTEEFYEDTPLETKQRELANIHGVEDQEGADAAALSESVSNEQPLPQTGDQGAGDEPNEAALEEENETAEAALKLDDMAALAQSDQTAREFVQERHGVNPSEYDDDIELRDAIYGDVAAAGGDD